MEKMWSPWRSLYIESFKEKKEGDVECIFCNAAMQNADDNDSLVVYQGDKAFVVMNLYPYNNGHIMIVPKRHLSDILNISEEEMTEINRLLKLSVKALKKVLSPQGFNIGLNVGKAAGAGIDTHLHYHIVPRWNGDTNFMPVLGKVKIISQDLLETKNNLIAEFRKLI